MVMPSLSGGAVALGKQRGDGLHHICQRMSLLNGTVSLRTSPGQGMQYALHIPVPRGNGEVGLE
jgi:signal transduction histidine kinase